MLFLNPDEKEVENSFFHCSLCSTCYSLVTRTFRPKSNLEGFVWSRQSITRLVSQRQSIDKSHNFTN